MKQTIESVFYEKKAEETADLTFLSLEEAKKARAFHETFPVYQETPLIKLGQLAKELGVASIHVKDESFRFGLNAFKVLGGSYALGRLIADRTGQDISSLSASGLTSREMREKTGELTFVTATDGNHGRGVAWTARELGQKAVVYMPKGSAQERLLNIRAEGAEASITDKNYDDAVRLAEEMAKKNGWLLVQDTAWEGYTAVPAWIMQGYLTLGLEAAGQLEKRGEEPPTHIFLQAGVGSLAGALCGFFTNYYKEQPPVFIVVEPNQADCIYRTAKADDGMLHTVSGDMDTIMAGLACGEPNPLGWEVLKNHADAFLSCPDYVAADGMRVLAAPAGEDAKIVSGESGAAPLGAAYHILTDSNLSPVKDRLRITEASRLLFISTEGDTDRENYREVVWNGKYSKYEGKCHL